MSPHRSLGDIILSDDGEDGPGRAVPPPVPAAAEETAEAEAGPAMEALLAAYDSSAGGRDQWVNYSIRLHQSLSRAVAQRRVRDIRGTGLPIFPCYYLQASIDRLPKRKNGSIEPVAAGEIGQAWREAHLRDPRISPASPGNRLRLVTSGHMKQLRPDLNLLPYTVTLQDVASGALYAFLADLKAGR